MKKMILLGAVLVTLMVPVFADQPVSRSGWMPDPNATPPAAPMPCQGQACPSGGSYIFFTDESEFLDAIAPGFYDEDFADIPVGAAGPSLNFSGNGFSYTATAVGDGSNNLYNDPALLSVDSAFDLIRITFTGDPVFAVGGNLFATDINFSPTGAAVVLTLEDGSTETIASTSSSTFGGFITSSAIVFMDIDAPNAPSSSWPALNRLYVGVAGAANFSVGGTLSGLAAGNSVTLQNTGADDLVLTDNGSFEFSSQLADGESYEVTVLTQPEGPNQTCTVINGSGTINEADVTDIEVTCVTETYTIGGTVSGLAGGTLVLQNNGGDNLSITANGGFTFATALDDGSAYEVTVLTQPSSPNQTCTVSSGSGTLAGENVEDVVVTCATETYSVGGTLSGLEPGTSVVLQNNGNDDLALNSDGAFTFATPVADGAAYEVTILTQPAGQNCTVSNGSGSVAGADVEDVAVACAALQLNVSTNDLNIGTTSPGGTLLGALTLTNPGPGDVEVTSLTGLASPFALAGGSCPAPSFTLASGESCTISIEFAPQATGSFESTLDIANSATGEPITVTVRGMATPAIAVNTLGPGGLIALLALLMLVGMIAVARIGSGRPV